MSSENVCFIAANKIKSTFIDFLNVGFRRVSLNYIKANSEGVIPTPNGTTFFRLSLCGHV